MEECRVDLAGDMAPPRPQGRSFLDFTKNMSQSFAAFQGLPSITDVYKFAKNNMRPWMEFINAANFKTVASMPRLTSRVVRNLSYFQCNYGLVFIILMVYCLITSPLLLLVLIAVSMVSQKVQNSNACVVVCGHEISPKQQGALVYAAFIPVLFLVGAATALFWTLGASVFVILLHAIFYNIDAIVTEDTEDTVGFLAEVV